MYEGERIDGLSADSYATCSYDEGDPKTINVVRSVTDTIHAEIVQSKPRPLALTKGGDAKARKKAKQITKLAEAVLYDSGGDVEASAVVRDAVNSGSGAVKIYEHDGRVRCSRVLIECLHVDAVEAHQGKPRTLYYGDNWDRAVLGEMFPERREDIEKANTRTFDGAARSYDESDGCTADLVEVVEIWRLPSSKTATDGRHLILVSSGVLLDEAWTDESFPFAFLHFSKPIYGFWGKGVAHILRGIQRRLDTLDDTIEECHWMLANARWFVPKGANVNLSHLEDNRHGPFIEYEGDRPPQLSTFQAVSPELYNQRDWLSRYAFEKVGVSQLAASSMKPAGLDSGRALRTYLDNQSKRFIELAQAYQEFYVEVARQSIRCARRLAEDDGEFTVVYRSKSQVETIRVADLEIDDDSYLLQVFPISMLPGTPAGKLAALQELRADGTISAETFYRLADFPDLDSERELQTAPRDLVDQSLDSMLETGVYVRPEPLDDHAMQLRVGLLRYQKARLDGTQEGELELLRRYLADVEAYLESKAAAAAPPPVDPMAPPGGAPLPDPALPPMAA